MDRFTKMKIKYPAIGFVIGALGGGGVAWLLDHHDNKQRPVTFYLGLGALTGAVGAGFGWMVAKGREEYMIDDVLDKTARQMFEDPEVRRAYEEDVAEGRWTP